MTADRPATTNGKRILIIEDEQFISELYVRALTKAGYSVEVIIDGGKALAIAETDAYDVILLDIMLPTVTGVEILKQLRDPARTTALKAKIIITTNLELDEEQRHAMESHADGYIIKAEITPKELAVFVDNLKLVA